LKEILMLKIKQIVLDEDIIWIKIKEERLLKTSLDFIMFNNKELMRNYKEEYLKREGLDLNTNKNIFPFFKKESSLESFYADFFSCERQDPGFTCLVKKDKATVLYIKIITMLNEILETAFYKNINELNISENYDTINKINFEIVDFVISTFKEVGVNGLQNDESFTV